MAENDMQEEALAKYGTCVDIYYEKHGSIPTEPLLYKVVLLSKMALQQDLTEKIEVLEQTLDLMDNYQLVLS